jgi:hypothetical protein
MELTLSELHALATVDPALFEPLARAIDARLQKAELCPTARLDPD